LSDINHRVHVAQALVSNDQHVHGLQVSILHGATLGALDAKHTRGDQLQHVRDDQLSKCEVQRARGDLL